MTVIDVAPLATGTGVPVTRPAPATTIGAVQAAVRTLLDATDINLDDLARDLDEVRKREVADYLGVLADGLTRLTSLFGAASGQVEQFLGDSDGMGELDEVLAGAFHIATDLAEELSPN